MRARLAAFLVLMAAAGAAAANPASVVAALGRRETAKLLGKFQTFGPDLLKELGPGFSGTLFAPSNAAVLAAEKAGIELTNDILRYHIVPGPPAPITAINDDQIFVTLLGETLQAQWVDGKLTIDGKASNAHVVPQSADIMIGVAQYAVVHVIDNVLLPYAPAKPAVPGGGASGAKVPKPSHKPAKPVPKKPSGGAVTVPNKPVRPSGGSTVGEASIGASPPAASAAPSPAPVLENSTAAAPSPEPVAPSPEPLPLPSPAVNESLSVIEALNENGLTALVDFMEELGVDYQFGPGYDFSGTLFAPSNQALTEFATANNITGNLTDDQRAIAVTVLGYHVVSYENYPSSALQDGQTLMTAAGEAFTVSIKDGKVFLNTTSGQTVEVSEANIEAGPAVIHVVDGVLVPASVAPAPSPVPVPPSSAVSTVASAAAVAASLLVAALLA